MKSKAISLILVGLALLIFGVSCLESENKGHGASAFIIIAGCIFSFLGFYVLGYSVASKEK